MPPAPPQLLRGLLASFPYSSPRAPAPRAWSCLEPKAPARDLRGQRLDRQLMPLGAFLMWSLRPTSVGNPQARMPWRYTPKGTVYPYVGKEIPVFPALHGGTWNSPVGKPHGKASRERHRSLDPRDGKRDTAATAQEESARACPLSRRRLTLLGRLQKYRKINVTTGEESSGSASDSTQGLRRRHRWARNPERPPSNSHGE